MSARSCRDIRADLSAYLDGDLDTALTGSIRAHLDGCEACRSELELLRLAVGALRRLPDLPPPAAILTGVRARLRPEPWYRRFLDGRQWLLGMPIGALATVLVVVGIALFQARYPDMQKTVTQAPWLQSPALPEHKKQAEPAAVAPETQAKTAAIAPPSPADRSLVAARRPAPPVRGDLRAKGVLGPSRLSQGVHQGKEIAVPESSTFADADEKDDFRTAPAATVQPVTPIEPVTQLAPYAPAEPAAIEPETQARPPAANASPSPVAPNAFSAGGARVDQMRQSESELRVGASMDSLREESRPVQSLEAAPPQSAIPMSKPAAENKVMVNAYPTGQPAGVTDRPLSGTAGLDEIGDNSRSTALPAAKKKEARAAFDRNADSGAALRYSRLAGEKAAASTRIEVVCRLDLDSDTVGDLERLLRREGARNIVVGVLEPRTVREAFAPYRGQADLRTEPSRGWTVTANFSSSEIARLFDVLQKRKSLNFLGPPSVPAVSQDPAERRDLRITILQ